MACFLTSAYSVTNLPAQLGCPSSSHPTLHRLLYGFETSAMYRRPRLHSVGLPQYSISGDLILLSDSLIFAQESQTSLGRYDLCPCRCHDRLCLARIWLAGEEFLHPITAVSHTLNSGEASVLVR